MSTQSDIDFEFISMDDMEFEEPPSDSMGRRAKRYAARSAEAIAGLPGDMVQLIRSMATSVPEIEAPIGSPALKGVRSLMESIPGSEDLGAMSAEMFPDLQPQSEFERVEDEIVSDLAVLALPVKGKVPFARALGMSVSGNLGKEVVGAFGGSDTAQESTKLGMMLFTGLFKKGRGIQKHISNLYRQSERFVPEGAAIRYPTKKLDSAAKILQKGGSTKSKEAAITKLNEMRSKIADGEMSVLDSVQFDKDIGEKMRQASSKQERFYLQQLKDANAEALEAYAKENPSWAEFYKEGKMAHAGIAQSEKIQEYIRKNVSLKDLGHAALALGLEEAFLPGRAAGQIASGAALAGGVYSAEIARRLSRNPALRKYYINVLNASVSENAPSLVRNMKGLDRVLKKDMQENPSIDIDMEEFDFS